MEWKRDAFKNTLPKNLDVTSKKYAKKIMGFFRKYDLQKKTTKLSFRDFNFSNIFRLTFSIWSDTAIVFGSVNHSNISSSSNSSPSYLI